MTIPPPIRALFAHVVDYAGTFPPASLTLDAALSTYARELAGPDAWLLGRFVIGAESLETIEQVSRLNLSVIAGPDARAALAHVEAFNTRWTGRARVSSIEFSAVPPAEIASLMRLTGNVGTDLEAFFEAPIDADLRSRLDAISSARAAAKLRTGGTTPADIPSPAAIAEFLYECAERRLSFKATAGLHHAVRNCYPLTYERDSTTTVMHGFLNVVSAASVAATGAQPSDIAATLEESSAHTLMRTALRSDPVTSRRFFRSFGSCSFREPADELTHVLADLKVGTTF